MRLLARIFPCILLFVGGGVAQTQWKRPPLMDARESHAIAYDAGRQRVVLFGGTTAGSPNGETWEWDGDRWIQRFPGNSPPARAGHAMTYDSTRQRVLLFGGRNTNFLLDTWEWDGTDWTQRIPTAFPPARADHALAFDSVRGRVVMFGGRMLTATADDTWEWDGSDWLLRSSALTPLERSKHTMTFDAGRGRVVLFGGKLGAEGLGDTWEWDGVAWSRAPVSGPAPAPDWRLTHDGTRGVSVLVGSASGAVQTWEWDGTTWLQQLSQRPPSGRRDHAIAYDGARQSVVMVGGFLRVGGPVSDTWEWDGSDWSRSYAAPTPRTLHSMAYDAVRARTVLFGGRYLRNDTWEWDGTEWREVQPTTSPPGREEGTMAWHAGRGKTVLFGGFGGGYGVQYLADTWEWDGVGWTQLVSPTNPAPRTSHAMAYDDARDRLVVFGGYLGSGRSASDTWEWDGTVWTERFPATRPRARWGHAMAYDKAHGRTVMLGWNSIASAMETWEWDGVDWTQRSPTNEPYSRVSFPMEYDSARERVVVYGGSYGLSDLWEWDGSEWMQRNPTPPPGRRGQHAAAYDSARGRFVSFGGFDYSTVQVLGDTWEYHPVQPASFEPFGAGCAGSGGTPTLTAPGRPWIGELFSARLGPLPTGGPAFMLLGGSRTQWGVVPLPLPLGSLGWPACTLLVSLDVVVPVPSAGGSATWSVPLCACPSLVGGSLFAQGGAVDPRGGVVFSNAATLLIGEK